MIDSVNAQKQSQKILPLTSMRFFAALYVVFYHELTHLSSLASGHSFLERFCSLGYISVSLFFFLSGFVLALAYLAANKPIDLRRFLVARFARIYPLLFACLLFDLPHFFYTQRHGLQHHARLLLEVMVVSFAALESWFPKLGGLDSPSWSIAAEFFFYLVFPILGTALWKLSMRASILAAALLYAAGNGIVLWLMLRNVPVISMEYNPLTHLYCFLLGICLAKFYLRAAQHPVWRSRLRRWSPAMLVASLLAFLAIPFFALPIPEMLLQHGILIPLYAAGILSLCSGHPTIERFFATKTLVILGEASFALYLIHMPLGMVLRRVSEPHGILGALVVAGVAIGLSVLSFYWLETPSRRWIMRRFHTRSQENVVVQAAAQ